MDYKIEYLQNRKIISVKMKGRLNYQLAEQYSKEAIKLAHQYDCKNYLLNHSETEMQSGVNKIHASGEELQQFGFKNTDRIAIVINNRNHDINSLEPAIHNSRWSIFKYFSEAEIEKAFEWLSETN